MASHFGVSCVYTIGICICMYACIYSLCVCLEAHWHWLLYRKPCLAQEGRRTKLATEAILLLVRIRVTFSAFELKV